MQLRMLGTGNAFAKKYYNNNALITSNDYRLMIDCGVTATTSLHELEVPIGHIDGIVITHLHADHVGGLEEVAFQNKYIWNKKNRLYVPEDLIEPLWENCLKAGMDEPLRPTRLEDFFHVVPMQEGSPVAIAPGLTVEILRTRHVPGKSSYSLFVNDIFYSADVMFDRDLIHDVYDNRQCRWILHDCQLNSSPSIHAGLDELLTLPEQIQERIYLMHYEDNKDQFMGKTGKMRFLEQHVPYEF